MTHRPDILSPGQVELVSRGQENLARGLMPNSRIDATGEHVISSEVLRLAAVHRCLLQLSV
jgi:hypothetical protein